MNQKSIKGKFSHATERRMTAGRAAKTIKAARKKGGSRGGSGERLPPAPF